MRLRIGDCGLRIALLLALAGVVPRHTVAQEPAANDVLVFAAASLKEVVDEIAAAAQPSTGTTIRVSYAASSALARQIEAGAPAHIFISADTEWMDYLAGKDLIQSASRVDLVGNSLVLIAPTAEPVPLKIARGFELASALGRGRLAVADPAAVPAGKYARAALTSLGIWDSVANRLAPADNVRSALALVARGEAPLGIVYRTDALVEPKVRIVDTFPGNTHPSIVYPAALTKSSSRAAVRVLEFLRSPTARAIFERRGFILPVS
jgi:molybdate transport system substrate-binding protein